MPTILQSQKTRRGLIVASGITGHFDMVQEYPTYWAYTAAKETVVFEHTRRTYLTAAEYPALAEVWDNDSDSIFDTM